MLYCPQCGAEYREGDSSCSDCHVLLVRERVQSGERDIPPEPGDPNHGPYADFWKGEDPRIHAELCSLLDEAEIPHITIRREDHLFNLTRQPQLQIAVPFSALEKAEAIVAQAFGEPPELPAPEGESTEEPIEPLTGWRRFVRASADKGLLPAMLEKMREPREEEIENDFEPEVEPKKKKEARLRDPDDWYAGHATVEVWSGLEPELAEMIRVSLQENEIPSRQDELKGSQSILVEPKDQDRAREIVREIVEGVPPE